MSPTRTNLRLHLFGLEFIPRLIPIISLLCVLPILLSLGVWQLHRADYKRQLTSAFSKQSKAAPITLLKIPADVEKYSFYRVKLTGHYDNQKQLLLDNRYHNHQPGYEVLTPFILTSGESILVNRGWVPLGKSRNILPELQPITDQQIIVGTLKQIPETVFHLGKENQQGWPRVIESLSQQTLSTVFPNQHQHIQPMVLLLSKNAPHGFLRDFKITTVPASKHMGYAVQWLALAAVFFILSLKTMLNNSAK